ncbi:MAG: phospho-sugar mutase [Eubacteriales bacterium]|nr:phospho-sugar mutase [Eubacteriales bacterium]MDD4716516.1 phospho-sugar mutase [Eubacteriales bacterium]
MSTQSDKLFKLWSEDPFFSEDTRRELIEIADDSQEITERFYKYLEFGTGGLRGIIGAGTNRMNIYTVAHATEGFARYLDRPEYADRERRVVVSYDSRRFSREFAMVTSLVFASHGIKVLLSDELRPTPMLSYAVRHFDALGGVMITASHNPAKYNGYKAYGEDGGQMPPEAASNILESMHSIDDIRTLRWISEEEAFAKGLIEYFGSEFDEVYIDMLKSLVIDQRAIEDNRDMKIVYTPLHGAGLKPVTTILSELGFRNVYVVKEQSKPDPDFSTVRSPNPEERSALKMAMDLATEVNADLVVATDPDGDRTGLVVREPDGDFSVLSGNQIGLLLMDHILSAKEEAGTLTPLSFTVTTIVSSKLTRRIAKRYGVRLFEVLTGFKFIAEIIKEYDENGDMSFEFGFEESYGFLAGKDVRDKDAVVAIMLIAEMAASARSRGKSLYDVLQELYEKYGYAAEKTISITFEGKEGIEKIRDAMTAMRQAKHSSIGDVSIASISDYLGSEITDHVTGKTVPLDFEKSNVLLYSLGDDDWFCIRPSGTEPKIKIYFGIYGKDRIICEKRLDDVSKVIEKHIRELL